MSGKGYTVFVLAKGTGFRTNTSSINPLQLEIIPRKSVWNA